MDQVAELPEPLRVVLADYDRHLSVERDLSDHTVRAYLADVESMLRHAVALGHAELEAIDLRDLRSWLARERTLGRRRTTMARRATAVRVFTAWLTRTGRIDADPGAALGSPKAHRPLPAALRADEVRLLLDAAAEHALTDGAVGLRDLAILELLYATGIRVGELCGLDVDDLDHERRVVRVFGKGRKDRVVPYGVPAARALDRWLTRGRPALVAGTGRQAGGALFLGARGGRIDQRAVRT